MKTTIYNFRKVYIVLLLLFLGIQFGFSQLPLIDADISLISVSPLAGPFSYGQKITYNFQVTNNSIALYPIDRVVLRNYLPKGLEYQQADNSLTWIELSNGEIEASSNDFIPALGSAKDYSVVLTIVRCDGDLDASDNKFELFHQGNTDIKNIKIEEEAIPNGFEFDISLNSDWT